MFRIVVARTFAATFAALSSHTVVYDLSSTTCRPRSE